MDLFCVASGKDGDGEEEPLEVVSSWYLSIPPVFNSQIETYHFADEVTPSDSSGH